MIYKVEGIERKVGVYQDRPYDNTYLHLTTNEFLKKEFIGRACSVVKVPTSLLPQTITENSVIDLQYNAYGKILSICHVGGKGV